MQFSTLNRSLLVDFKFKGYNLLTSYNALDLTNPTWQPLRVSNIQEYLLQYNFNTSNIYLKKPAILFIDVVLNCGGDRQLVGEVFIEDNHLQRLQQKCKL